MIKTEIAKDIPTINWTDTTLYVEATNCSPKRNRSRMITANCDAM
jgi:hypothetical protein